MSAKATFWAWEQEISNASRKLVLLKLADNANDKGQCWPSYSYIAKHTGMNRRSVMRHIKQLSDDGFIQIRIRKTGKKGKLNESNVYILNVWCGDKMTPPPKTEVQNGSDNLSPRVMTKDHQDSDKLSPGVVTDDHQGSDPVSPGVVTHCHPEPNNLESNNEPNVLGDAFEVFWQAGMRKSDRKNAKLKFENITKKKIPGLDRKMDPMAFAHYLAKDIKKRISIKQQGFDKLLPTTYLNGERWRDEIKPCASSFSKPDVVRANHFRVPPEKVSEVERRESDEKLRLFQQAAERQESKRVS